MQQQRPCTGIIYQLKQGRMSSLRAKKPPRDGGKQKITCMNSLNNVSESNFAASRPEKQFTRDAVRRSLTR